MCSRSRLPRPSRSISTSSSKSTPKKPFGDPNGSPGFRCPLRRIQTGPCCRRVVTAASSSPFGRLSRGYVRFRVLLQRSARPIGLPDPALALPFPGRLRGLPAAAIAPFFRRGWILSCASSLLRVFRDQPARRLPATSTFLGVCSPSRRQPKESTTARVAPGRPQTSHVCGVPSSTFRTSSTAYSSLGLAGLFHPAATSGIRPSGVLLREQPHGLVVRRGPLGVRARLLPAVAHRRQRRAPVFRALLRSRIRRGTELFRLRTARSPLGIPPSSGSSLRTPRPPLTAVSPATVFHDPRRIEHPQPDLLLRVCLPGTRFPACARRRSVECEAPSTKRPISVAERFAFIASVIPTGHGA